MENDDFKRALARVEAKCAELRQKISDCMIIIGQCEVCVKKVASKDF